MSQVDVLVGGCCVFEEVNVFFGLVLVEDEIDYLVESFIKLGCNFNDIELMMFVQVNLEYCCYKIFNVDWIIDGVK